MKSMVFPSKMLGHISRGTINRKLVINVMSTVEFFVMGTSYYSALLEDYIEVVKNNLKGGGTFSN